MSRKILVVAGNYREFVAFRQQWFGLALSNGLDLLTYAQGFDAPRADHVILVGGWFKKPGIVQDLNRYNILSLHFSNWTIWDWTIHIFAHSYADFVKYCEDRFLVPYDKVVYIPYERMEKQLERNPNLLWGVAEKDESISQLSFDCIPVWPHWVTQRDQIKLNYKYPDAGYTPTDCLSMIQTVRQGGGWLSFAYLKDSPKLSFYLMWKHQVPFEVAELWTHSYMGLYELCGGVI